LAVYGHEVTLAISNMEWNSVVYFAEVENFPVNVVGRVGFLDHLQSDLLITSKCFAWGLTMLLVSTRVCVMRVAAFLMSCGADK
jgi:hypothetical protein